MTTSLKKYGAVRRFRWAAAIAIVSVLFLSSACGGKVQKKTANIPEPLAKLVAVMPVNNDSGNKTAEKLLRDKVAEGVFFKGYRRVPLASVDEAISRGGRSAGVAGDGSPAAQKLREILGVDGLLYITLSEASVRIGSIQVTVAVDASFELISAGTGVSLWKSKHRAVKRAFALSKKGREQTAFSIFENVVEKVVEAGLTSFPEGPVLADGRAEKNK
ncbi:MAG: DUF799 family lipoprotein [Smithellaceae bacterium]|nr:DUF799 family lipoprotein [Smithellaceae bacterium]